VLAWRALKVHDAVDKLAVDRLAVLGTGVRESGEVVQNGFEKAGEAASGIPVVGGDVADALRDAGSAPGRGRARDPNPRGVRPLEGG
jgi:hypothetical protein